MLNRHAEGRSKIKSRIKIKSRSRSGGGSLINADEARELRRAVHEHPAVTAGLCSRPLPDHHICGEALETTPFIPEAAEQRR